MTLEELTRLNALVAKLERRRKTYLAEREALSFLRYRELWVELRDGWGMDIPIEKAPWPPKVGAIINFANDSDPKSLLGFDPLEPERA